MNYVIRKNRQNYISFSTVNEVLGIVGGQGLSRTAEPSAKKSGVVSRNEIAMLSNKFEGSIYPYNFDA